MRDHINILQLRASPFLGSPEKMIVGRIKSISGNSKTYYMGVFDEQDDRENDFIIELRRLKAPAFKLHPSVFRLYNTIELLMKIIRTHKIHLICSNDYKSNFVAFILGKICKIPIVSVFHGRTGKDLKVRLYEKIDSVILKSFDAVIAVCDHAKELLKKNSVHAELIHTIPNAVDIDSLSGTWGKHIPIRKEFNLNEKDRLVVFIGRLSVEKGLIYLLQASLIISKEIDNVKILLIGDGSYRKKIEGFIQEYGLSENVLLTGYRKDVHRFFDAMNFLVLPSLTEGMPVVILEAFAAGKAVVASRVGGIPEIVSHGINGLLVEPGNVEQLADAMCRMVNDDEMTRQMGINGLKMVRKKYSFPVQVNNYNRLYQFVLENSCNKRK